MTKQPYFVNSTEKQIDVQYSFDGGMVSQAHPEKLKDNQSVIMENVDLKAGGLVEARGGYNTYTKPSTALTGNTQGYFVYKSSAGDKEIVAMQGKLYVVTSGTTYTEIPITSLPSFQTTRLIDAIQFRDKMYFATGSGLVIYNGTNAYLIDPYAPNPLEALYIGTNGLAANPESYLSDSTGAAHAILGVVPDKRYGVINQWVTFTVYSQTISGEAVEYQFETKRSDELEYQIMRTWSTTKTFTTQFPTKADYQVRVSLRRQIAPDTVLSQYILPRYRVNTVPEENPEPSIDFEDMKLCNRIFLHYDRLCLYGDTNNPENLYISHLHKFNYFPRTNIQPIIDPARGSLRSVKQYKDFLICFTDNSIQKIEGKSPQEFVKSPVHMELGTTFPYSVQVMKNYIIFAGNDNGIYILKSFNFSSADKLNVERVDEPVMDVVSGLLKTSPRVVSTIYDNQYYLYIENGNGAGTYIYRFYYETGMWVRDKIANSIMFANMYTIKNKLICITVTNGWTYQLKDDVFFDDESSVYSIRISSKHYNFGYPHHRKKLKQYQILAKITTATTINVKLYADNTLVSDTNLTNDVNQNSDAQKLKVMVSGRFRYVKSEVTIPVKESVQLVGFAFIFKLNTPK